MHERERITDLAENEFTFLLLDWIKKYELTDAETIEILADATVRRAVMQKRFDRHGRYDIKACVAPEDAETDG